MKVNNKAVYKYEYSFAEVKLWQLATSEGVLIDVDARKVYSLEPLLEVRP